MRTLCVTILAAVAVATCVVGAADLRNQIPPANAFAAVPVIDPSSRSSVNGVASVVETGGVPRFAIDGKPIAATAVMPSPAGKPGVAAKQLKAFREAGVMLSSDVWTMHDKRYNPRQWWLGEGEYDFELFDALAKGLVDASPDGFIFPRIKIDPPKKWCEAHPDEMMDDISPRPESKSWRALYRRMFKDMIDHVERSSYADNVIGYHIGAFSCGEWLTGEWKSEKHRAYILPVSCDERDPLPPLSETAARRAAIDNRSEAVADMLIDAASCVKEFTGGRRLVGAFFGYPAIAHEKVMRVIRSGKVDFFAAPPHYYALREPGRAGTSQAHFLASYRLHGRVYFEESDFRTFLSDPTFAPSGMVRLHPLGEAVGMVRRSIGKSLAGGWENWWFLLGGNNTFSAPELMESIRIGVEEERRTLGSARWTPAEVAVFTAADEYATSGGGTHAREFRKQCRFDLLVNVLPSCGVPFDSYELSDIADPQLPEYKVYLFPNAFTLSEGMREKIKDRVRRAGKTAVWVYAPGYFRNGVGDKANVEDMVGITLERRQLGETAYASWMLEPSGGGICARDGWRSVFMPMPPDAAALRKAFREAGAHVWMETDDVIAAGRGYLMVHASKAGAKRVLLPCTSDVKEVFGAAPERKCVTGFVETMEVGETRVYSLSAAKPFM